MSICAKFSSTPEINSYTSVESVFNKPEAISEEHWGVAKMKSLVAPYMLFPLAQAHNNEMASDHGSVRKFATVSLYAAGMAFGSLLGVVEAVIRFAIGIITSPLLSIMFCESKSGACLSNTLMISAFLGFVGVEESVNAVQYGFSNTYKSFTKSGDLDAWTGMGTEKKPMLIKVITCDFSDN